MCDCLLFCVEYVTLIIVRNKEKHKNATEIIKFSQDVSKYCNQPCGCFYIANNISGVGIACATLHILIMHVHS